MTQTLADTLGVDYSLPALTQSKQELQKIADSTEILDDDFEKIRTALLNTMELTQELSRDLKVLAKETQHTKMYEELSRSIGATISAAAALASVHRTKRAIAATTNKFDKVDNLNIYNNDVKVIGTTTDIIDRIRERIEGPIGPSKQEE